MEDFLRQPKHADDQPVTLLDCCSGGVQHLNLKHVVIKLLTLGDVLYTLLTQAKNTKITMS